VSFPGVPTVETGPPRSQSPGPPQDRRALSASLLGALAVLLLGTAGIAVIAFGWKRDTTPAPSRPAVERQRAVSPAADEREPSPAAAPAAKRAVSERPEAEPEPAPEPQKAEPPAEWPPARAFTARCKAAGGGCVEQCTTLAGGRCLDPCFIHTAECSRDCLLQDGTCGWPPPDTE
jgi:hypothetical protein